MPELPEVETARAVIAEAALDREIAAVDDSDTWVCRPLPPGQIAAALVGRRLVAANRRGKTMWCDTSDDGPVLSLHLGMSGRIVVTDPDGHPVEGGDPVRGLSAVSPDRDPVWDRFTIEFADGGVLRLFDKRRLGRVGLDPDLTRLGPDAGQVRASDFRVRMSRGRAPVKARLLDQSVIAGVGNLLADETLWQARLDPHRRVDTLDRRDLDVLLRALRAATKRAIRRGGVHTGEVIAHRKPDGHCPRCGSPMARATVGGRTTWFCPVEQV
ncbi:Fpg/Nei family DNA glycosylase [Nocardioides currus]|uniref:Formamidopyrimidine-DNA glycosylase n=1 Tax=Nocardioides currus TaxID=2133958 RepID=A0A2R7YUD4_9ACTN|nr:DNA-formamidopyrimidine glycosylase family protein [Nocardioides currus]PUA80030.1 formamidopyrimidine-DNA glycosylase [Nocardioides currus]